MEENCVGDSMANGYLQKDGTKFYPVCYYPIGSIYMSTVSTNPKEYFGGTWEPINNKFLVSHGTSFTAGTTGGSLKHSHTLNSHSHTAAKHTHGSGGMTACIGSPTGNAAALGFASTNGQQGPNSDYSVGGNTDHASGHPGRAHNCQLTGYLEEVTPGNHGSSTANCHEVNHCPPWYAVYMWKRTA